MEPAIPLGTRVILPDGRRGGVIAASCDEPILCVKVEGEGEYLAIRSDQLTEEALLPDPPPEPA
jgi:hypothetical protein